MRALWSSTKIMNIINLIIFNFLLLVILIFIKRWKKSFIFSIGLLWSMMDLIFIVFIYLSSNQSFYGHLSILINFIPNKNINFNWGNLIFMVDGISLVFISLSIILIPICLLISYHTINKFFKEFVILLYLNLIFLIIVFSIFDILGFYILFESILIPVFLMIGLWGSRVEKIKAAFYFFFYTLIGSLLMLVSIFKIYQFTGTCNYANLVNIILPESVQLWLFLGFFLSLSVKIPMIPFHIWLPQAHVEAPVAGSVLLAGILLKLGGYGFIRFSYPLFPIASEYFTPIILVLSLISIIFGALTTCRQIDIKRLIAYSSVSHMGLVTVSIFCHSMEGLVASILMMLAHGLVSSGLFMTSSIIYWRFHSRLIKYFKGLAFYMPVFSILVFILILGNISFPLTLNFISELISIIAAIKLSLILGILCCLGSFFGVIYSFYLYNRIFFGQSNNYISNPREVNIMEFNSFIPLILFTLIFGILPNFIINIINLSSFMNISL